MDKSTNSLNWFEIAATDIKRAKEFYETVFQITMEDVEMPGMQTSMFPWEPGSGKVNGSLVQSENHKPGMDGTIIYMNANPNMDSIIARVEVAGGKVIAPKMGIGEHGHIALIIDTEGNRIGLHSQE